MATHFQCLPGFHGRGLAVQPMEFVDPRFCVRQCTAEFRLCLGRDLPTLSSLPSAWWLFQSKTLKLVKHTRLVVLAAGQVLFSVCSWTARKLLIQTSNFPVSLIPKFLAHCYFCLDGRNNTICQTITKQHWIRPFIVRHFLFILTTGRSVQ